MTYEEWREDAMTEMILGQRVTFTQWRDCCILHARFLEPMWPKWFTGIMNGKAPTMSVINGQEV